jgi:hypothetical protein
MNITNTMCRLSELSQWEIDSLRDAMGVGCFDFFSEESFIGFTKGGCAGTWLGSAIPEIISYTEMMQILGKTMQFTKSDLKSGLHFVKDRDGVFYAVCRNTFCGLNEFFILSRFDDKLISMNGHSGMDIVEVYETYKDRSMSSYLKGLGLRRVWERTEQTPAQKEMEVLQAQAKALQEQITKLQGTL